MHSTTTQLIHIVKEGGGTVKDKIQSVIENLKQEREEYGDRIVSLDYAYDSAIEQLEELLKEV